MHVVCAWSTKGLMVATRRRVDRERPTANGSQVHPAAVQAIIASTGLKGNITCFTPDGAGEILPI